MSFSGRFFVATPSGRSCPCASQTGIARSPTWTGSSAQPADTQNASGRYDGYDVCVEYEQTKAFKLKNSC